MTLFINPFFRIVYNDHGERVVSTIQKPEEEHPSENQFQDEEKREEREKEAEESEKVKDDMEQKMEMD